MIPKIYVNTIPDKSSLSLFKVMELDLIEDEAILHKMNDLIFGDNVAVILHIKDRQRNLDKLLKLLEDYNEVFWNVVFHYGLELPDTLKSRAVIIKKSEDLDIKYIIDNVKSVKVFRKYSNGLRNFNAEQKFDGFLESMQKRFFSLERKHLAVNRLLGHKWGLEYIYLKTAGRLDIGELYKAEWESVNDLNPTKEWLELELRRNTPWQVFNKLKSAFCYRSQSTWNYKITGVYEILNGFRGTEFSLRVILAQLLLYLQKRNVEKNLVENK